MEDDKDFTMIDILSDETNEQMTKNRKQLSPRLLKLHAAVAESLLLTEFNIQEKAMLSANIAHGWVTTLFGEEAALKRLETKKEQMEEAFVKKYGKKDTPRWETTEVMAKDEKIKAIEAAIEEQADICRYLTETVKIIKQSQWDIKNVVSIMQLEK